MNRAFIVSSDREITDRAVILLKSEGFAVRSFSCANALRRSFKEQSEPDIVLIDAPLTDEFGQDLALELSESSTSGLVLLCRSDMTDDMAEKVSDTGIAVVSKPLNSSELRAALKFVAAARSRMMGLKKENAGLLSKIDEMRLINRAKRALMEYLRFTEPQAHRYIEKQAMNTRQTRREVALRILATYEK